MASSSRAVERVTTPAVALPGHVGQATAIEQSRAVAEVQAAIVVAQNCPRDMDKALAEMRRSCQQRGLAERAFFSYPKAGSTVTGATVHLARELARCFGNLQYGIAELRRDDEAGLSEMQAYAWDVQTNTRSTQIFVVPHRRDKKVNGRPTQERIVDLRDVYENNANAGARRLRAAIFSILPAWFTDEAQDLCRETLTGGTPQEVAARAAEAVQAFGRGGVTQAQLEAKVGRPQADWSAQDVADLEVLFNSLKRREITKEEAFPPPPVTADEIGSDLPPATADDPWPNTARPGGGA